MSSIYSSLNYINNILSFVVFAGIGHLPVVYVVSITYFIQHNFIGILSFVVFVGIGLLPEVSDLPILQHCNVISLFLRRFNFYNIFNLTSLFFRRNVPLSEGSDVSFIFLLYLILVGRLFYFSAY